MLKATTMKKTKAQSKKLLLKVNHVRDLSADELASTAGGASLGDTTTGNSCANTKLANSMGG